jgi:hypothetical protein
MLTKKTLLTITGTLLVLNLMTAHAVEVAPNFYVCKGQDVALTFSLGGFVSTPHVNLQLGKTKKRTYNADETGIETQTIPMGDLKTITLKYQPDVRIDKASFVIPTINLDDARGMVEARFKSSLILTAISTPFTHIPPLGVINPSRYIDLNCTASIVY